MLWFDQLTENGAKNTFSYKINFQYLPFFQIISPTLLIKNCFHMNHKMTKSQAKITPLNVSNFTAIISKSIQIHLSSQFTNPSPLKWHF